MDTNKGSLHLEYNRWLIKVERLNMPEQIVFCVHFENELPDITITKTKDASGNSLWSAEPVTMQLEAEQIGKLIDDYYTKNPGLKEDK